MPKPRVSVLLALITALLLSSSAVAQSAMFEDGTFDLDGWSEYGAYIFPPDNGSGSMDSTQQMEGGDYFLSFAVEGESVPMGSTSSAWAILIKDDAIFDLTVSGQVPIRTVDFSFVMRLPVDAGGNRTVTLALEQDGYVWAAMDSRVFTNADDGNDWAAFEITDLTAADFSFHTWGADGQPETPDFSDMGSEIRFGLATGTSCPATSDCTIIVVSEVHVDDWLVTVFDEDDPTGGGGTGGDGGTAGSPGQGTGATDGAGGTAGTDEYPDADGDCNCRVPIATGDPNPLFPFFLVVFLGFCVWRVRRRR